MPRPFIRKVRAKPSVGSIDLPRPAVAAQQSSTLLVPQTGRSANSVSSLGSDEWSDEERESRPHSSVSVSRSTSEETHETPLAGRQSAVTVAAAYDTSSATLPRVSAQPSVAASMPGYMGELDDESLLDAAMDEVAPSRAKNPTVNLPQRSNVVDIVGANVRPSTAEKGSLLVPGKGDSPEPSARSRQSVSTIQMEMTPSNESLRSGLFLGADDDSDSRPPKAVTMAVPASKYVNNDASMSYDESSLAVVRSTRRAAEYRARMRSPGNMQFFFAIAAFFALLVEMEFRRYPIVDFYWTVVALGGFASFCTLALLVSIMHYYYLRLQYLKARQSVAPEAGFLASGLLTPLLFEWLVCIWHVPPFLVYDATVDAVLPPTEMYLFAVQVFTCLTFLRCYLIVRFWRENAKLMQHGSRMIAAITNVKFDTVFVAKAVFVEAPGQAVVVVLGATMFVTAYVVYIFESTSPVLSWSGSSEHSLADSLWLVIITMTTVGYGDIVPRGWLTKSVIVASALIGVFLTAMLISVIQRALVLTPQQSRIVAYWHTAEMARTKRRLAAVAIQRFWRHFGSSRRAGRNRILNQATSLRFYRGVAALREHVKAMAAPPPTLENAENQLWDFEMRVEEMIKRSEDHVVPAVNKLCEMRNVRKRRSLANKVLSVNREASHTNLALAAMASRRNSMASDADFGTDLDGSFGKLLADVRKSSGVSSQEVLSLENVRLRKYVERLEVTVAALQGTVDQQVVDANASRAQLATLNAKLTQVVKLVDQKL